MLRNRWHLTGTDYVGSGYPDISWHGVRAWEPDWSPESRTLAFLLCGRHGRGGQEPDDYVYVAMNTHWEAHGFELPKLPESLAWHVFANTGMPAPDDVHDVGAEPRLADPSHFLLAPRSVAVLVGRPPGA